MRRRLPRPTAWEFVATLLLATLALTFVRPQWFRVTGDREAVARFEIQQVGAALETYRHDLGRYPTTSQGLEALVKAPPGLSVERGWYGPYITSPIPLDPWGQAYRYRGTDTTYRLWSAGAGRDLGGNEAGGSASSSAPNPAR
jgi:general secretion pathway protein G